MLRCPTDDTLDLLDKALLRDTANKRPRLTPPSLGRSIAWLADRRRDPTPINTSTLHGRPVVPYGSRNGRCFEAYGVPGNERQAEPANA
jgi:hypothetical protein